MKLEIKERIIYDKIITFDDGYTCNMNHLHTFLYYIEIDEAYAGYYPDGVPGIIVYLEKNSYIEKSKYYYASAGNYNEYPESSNSAYRLTENGIKLFNEIESMWRYIKWLI